MLQRYRINNCADIADDNGGYCLSEDVAEIEKSKWISALDKLPDEMGRYWCYIEEQNSLGKSHYQWNISFTLGRFHSDAGSVVTHWQPLPPPPTMTDKGGSDD